MPDPFTPTTTQGSEELPSSSTASLLSLTISVASVGARPEGPVVTARTGRPPLAAVDRIPEADGVQRIVVGVDGSAASRAALRRAADLAQDLGAELDVVQAWQYPPALHDWDAVPSNYGYLPMAPPVERVEQDARDDLAATVADVLGPDPVVTVTSGWSRVIPPVW